MWLLCVCAQVAVKTRSTRSGGAKRSRAVDGDDHDDDDDDDDDADDDDDDDAARGQEWLGRDGFNNALEAMRRNCQQRVGSVELVLEGVCLLSP
jgi:hypothetical protein